MKNIIILLFIFLNISTYAQESFLSKRNLNKMKSDFRYEGNYIGGIKNGNPFFVKDVIKPDVVVYTKDDFLKSLKNTSLKRKVIYIPNDVQLDLSNEKQIVIPSNVTIFSDRGIKGSSGAKIFTKTAGTFPLFLVSDNVEICGLQINGGDYDVYFNGIEFKGENSDNLNRYKNPVSTGLQVVGDNFVLENCELSGWTFSAVVIKGGSNNIIKYNFIHHNRRFGLGYGVTVDGGAAKIYANIFDFNRHDIAGTGVIGSAYEVFLNVFLANTYSDSIDMHGGYDRKDGTNIAGSYMYVYNNYFERIKGQRKAALLRGVPVKNSFFKNNLVNVFDSIPGDNIQNVNQFEQIRARGNINMEGNFIEKKIPN